MFNRASRQKVLTSIVATGTARREGGAGAEVEAAVLRKALESMPYAVPQDRVEVMRQKDPLYTGHDPLYGDAPKWYPVSVLVDTEKLVRIREALSSTTAGADLFKRLEDAERALVQCRSIVTENMRCNHPPDYGSDDCYGDDCIKCGVILAIESAAKDEPN